MRAWLRVITMPISRLKSTNIINYIAIPLISLMFSLANQNKFSYLRIIIVGGQTLNNYLDKDHSELCVWASILRVAN